LINMGVMAPGVALARMLSPDPGPGHCASPGSKRYRRLGSQARQAAALYRPQQTGLSPGGCAGRHKGKASWKQEVFLSRDYAGAWISMAPGEKTKTQFYADDRVFWVVQSGQMKVTIEGQEPFIASKHFLIQIPKRLQYSMETVGNEPSLRFEMRPPASRPTIR
jgi:mannose-6-phosphate isomerase-like protein (cupin superfamily)